LLPCFAASFSLLHCFVDLLLHCFNASLLRCLVASLIRCFVTSLLRCFVAALLRCVAWSRPSARPYCFLLGRRSEPPRCSRSSLLREFVLRCSLASSMCCFAASLLRCLDLGCIVVASLLRHVIASLLCGSLASPLRCFAASLLVEATSESRFEYAIRNHFSKSLVSVTLSSVPFHSAPHYSVN
jgi:hypothetical protein